MKHQWIYLAVVVASLVAAGSRLHAQARNDTIKANPNAVTLRSLFVMKGELFSQERLGSDGGSVGDINRDGLDDFAFFIRGKGYALVFYGDSSGIADTPADTLFGAFPGRFPPIGDFWGSGAKAIVVSTGRFEGDPSLLHNWLHVYRTDSAYIDEDPAITWDGWAYTETDTIIRNPDNVLAADLDRDGDDELIVVISLHGEKGSDGDRHGQLWIYEGGADFQLDEPAAIIEAPFENDHYFNATVGNFNGDAYPDLLTIADYAETEWYFYWGSQELPASGAQADHRAAISKFSVTPDIDGDQIQDILSRGVEIWRSDSDHDVQTRSFDSTDLDIRLLSRPDNRVVPVYDLGYLNSRRYAMLGGTIFYAGSLRLAGFSGSDDGPDGRYEAIFETLPELSGHPFKDIQPLGDVNGDGWDDVMLMNDRYPSDARREGVVIILAGGPYIPNDDLVMSVRQVELEQKHNALSLWPNPVRTELNIAWRGDLERMPVGFVVHDVLGRVVARGEVEWGGPAARWECEGIAAGTYFISIYDEQQHLLATEPIVKQ